MGALVTALLVAQVAQPPVFRGSTELVRLDVVVVDANGHAVRGLTADDFTLTDRGKPQRVSVFEEISHQPASSLLPRDVAADVSDNQTSGADRLVVLVLDDLHFQGKTDEVKDMASRVVSGLGTGASLALVTTSGSFGVEPTTDRALVLAEIDRFLDKFDPEGRRLYPGAQMPNPGPIIGAAGPVVERGPKDPARFFGDMGAFRTLQDVAKKLAGDGSRRNAFVWISGGMERRDAPGVALCEDPNAPAFHCGALAGLLDALQKTNVATYSITTGDFSSRTMQDVAEATGGFVTSADAFAADLPRLIEDLDHYYLLGFYPEENTGRGYRPVDIQVSRPGARVRFRKGYTAGGRASKSKNDAPLAKLAEGSLPAMELPLRLFAAATPGVGKRRPTTAIALEAQVPRSLLQDGSGLADTLQYAIWAVDLRRKKVVKNITREARFVLDAAEMADNRADPVRYQVHTTLPLEPGRYQLRASALSAKAHAGGSTYLEVIVPNYEKAPLEITAIVVARETPNVPIVRGGLGVGILPVAVTLDREFTTTESVRLLCQLTQRTRAPIDIEVALFTAAGDRARRLLVKQLTAEEPRALDLALDLSGLAPGGYRLRVVATSATNTVVRETGLIVKP
jgi:VWFA-related protein